MRKIVKATLLSLALAIPVWAGDIGQPIAPPDGDGRPSQTSTEPAKTGDIGCPIAGSQIAISLLQSLLALF